MGKQDDVFGRFLRSIVQDPSNWDVLEKKLLADGNPENLVKRARVYFEETNKANVKSYFRAVNAEGKSDDQSQDDQTDSAPLSNLKKVK